MAWNPFWNASERRVRAFWRLLLQLLLLVPLFLGAAYVFIPLVGSIAGSILAYLLSVTFSVWVAGRFLDQRRFTDFGLQLGPAWWSDFGFGLVLGVVLMGGIFLVELAFGWISVVGTLEDRSPEAGFPVVFAGVALIFTSVGFYEELLSRGYHVKNMAEGLHGGRMSQKAAVWIALLFASVLFGLGHAVNPNASVVSTVNIMAAGVFLGLGYVLTGQLALSIGLHISWNFAQGALFGFPVSGSTGFTAAQVFVVQQGGPALWTGGAFGPEAGLLGLIAMAAGSLVILMWVRARYGWASTNEALAVPPVSPADTDLPETT